MLSPFGWMREFDRRFTAPGPAERLGAVRVLVCLFGTVFIIVRSGYLFSVAALPPARFAPVGVLSFLDEPVPVWSVKVLVALCAVAGLAATLGWRYRVSGPVFALSFLALATYDNSWQQVSHTEHLLTLHLLVLAVAPAAEAYAIGAPRRVAPAFRFAWPLRLMSIITVTTYVIAGIAKLRHGGADWLTGDVLRNQIANDNVRKAVLGDAYSPLGGRLVQVRWPFPLFAVGTMCIELGAVFALCRGRVRTCAVLALWGLHVAILAIMWIMFIYPLSFVAFAALLEPQRLFAALGARRRAGRARLVAASGKMSSAGP